MKLMISTVYTSLQAHGYCKRGIGWKIIFGLCCYPLPFDGKLLFWTGEGRSPKGRLRKVARVGMAVEGVKWNKGVK
jgi:hypothetical protein